MFYITIFLIVLLIYIFHKYFTWNYDFWAKNKIPEQKPSYRDLRFKENAAYTFDKVYKKFKGYACVGRYQLRDPILLILDLELIKKIYIYNFNNFHDNPEFFDIEKIPLLKANPFVLKGDEWKQKRNEISPAFTTSRMKAMYNLIDAVCSKLTDYIKRETARNPCGGLDTKELFAKFATDVVSNCIFAVDAASFTEEKPIIREMGKHVFRIDSKFFFHYMLVVTFPFLKRFLEYPLFPKFVEEFFFKLMKDAIKYRTENDIDRQDYLQYLISLKEKKEINEEAMTSHGITFFFNGFDTASQLIANTLYHLALNKEVQTKLRQEINEIVNENGIVNFDALIKMKYLDQTINESLRIIPPLAHTIRQCTEDFEFEIAKDHTFILKKGMQVQIPIYSIHRDPEYYSEPLKFIPERFNEEFGGIKAFQEKGVFLPFGMGPRICVGKKFAVIQAKAAIVETIKNFKVSVNPKMTEPFELETYSFILIPKSGYWLDYKEI